MSATHYAGGNALDIDYALSIPAAAKAMGVSPRTMWRLIADGRVKSLQASQRRRIILTSEIRRLQQQGVG